MPILLDGRPGLRKAPTAWVARLGTTLSSALGLALTRTLTRALTPTLTPTLSRTLTPTLTPTVCAALLAATVVTPVAGCSVKAAGSVAQPTALELQLLGAYRRLDDELIRASSVRSAGPIDRAARDAVAAEAVEARAMQRFNQDDLNELKAAGCLAEGLGATLKVHPCALVDGDRSVARRRERVVAQENRARRAILAWAAMTVSVEAGQDRVTPEVRDEVRAAYARLLKQAALPGHLVEVTPGRFEAVPK